MSSAKSLILDFNSVGKALILKRIKSGPRIEPWEPLLKQVFRLKHGRLKQPFEIYLIDSVQEGYKALQKYP